MGLSDNQRAIVEAIASAPWATRGGVAFVTVANRQVAEQIVTVFDHVPPPPDVTLVFVETGDEVDVTNVDAEAMARAGWLPESAVHDLWASLPPDQRTPELGERLATLVGGELAAPVVMPARPKRSP